MARSKDRLPVDDTSPMKHSPFASLAGPAAVNTGVVSSPAAVKDAKAAKGPARAVIRLERKGHGGKEVTVVSHLALSTAALQEWLTALKGQLGCGGRAEQDELVFQGDQRDRLEPLLTARGVRTVVRG